MADSIVSQFRREYALPIETTRQVSTISQRDAISTLRRWEGMLVYVVTEGVTYILQGGTDNTSWISLVGLADAPVDGQSYVRKDGDWSLLPNILPDAPEDGETYGRNNGNWAIIPDSADAVWGGITGILADQLDLQAALDDKADETNVLLLDNTDAFTPDADYEPATKKYVDDNATTQSFNPFTMFAQGSNEFLCFASVIGRAGGTVAHGSPIVWEILDNSTGHGSSMIRTITDYGGAAIGFNYPNVKTVETFLINGDEQLATRGLLFGPTVGFTSAGIYAYTHRPGGFTLQGNGTTWTASGEMAPSLFQLDSLSSGLAKLGLTPGTRLFDQKSVVVNYVGSKNYRVKLQLTGLGSSVLGFSLIDIATNTVATDPPSTTDIVTISNWGEEKIAIPLNTWNLSSTSLGNNSFLNSSITNFWCIGFFELWMKIIPISSSILRAKWQDYPSITSYKLKRSTSFTIVSGVYVLTSPTTVYTGTALEYNDTGLTSNTMYYYQLTDQDDVEITQFNCKTL